MTTNVTKTDSPAPLEPLLTIEDMERLLQVNRRTVARLCKRGQLPKPLKLGGSVRWRRSDVAEAIDALVGKGRRDKDPLAAV